MNKRDNRGLTQFICCKDKNNHGFMMKFNNGWTISVRWGEANYSDYKNTVHSIEELGSGMHKANTAECAVWDPDGTWQVFGYDQVCGHMDSESVAKLLTEVSSRGADERLPEPTEWWEEEDETEGCALPTIKTHKFEDLNMEED